MRIETAFLVILFSVFFVFFFAYKAGSSYYQRSTMEQKNTDIKVKEQMENRIDSVIANISLCEMAIDAGNENEARYFAERARQNIFKLKNIFQNVEKSSD